MELLDTGKNRMIFVSTFFASLVHKSAKQRSHLLSNFLAFFLLLGMEAFVSLREGKARKVNLKADDNNSL